MGDDNNTREATRFLAGPFRRLQALRTTPLPSTVYILSTYFPLMGDGRFRIISRAYNTKHDAGYRGR